MALTLKRYQTEALAALESFFEGARGATDADAVSEAFKSARRAALGDSAPPVPYRPLSQDAPSVPQVCIRIPTGGGKTLLAAHAIERAARLYVGTGAPLALWLVPSNTIRTQTIDALKSPGHPYREALLEHYPADRLSVIDIAECEQLRAQDFGNRAIVAVGTIQTLRVDNTASRDVYAYKEAFEPHFSAVPDRDYLERIGEADLEAQPYLTRADLGRVKRSFANLLAWHRPIVIVDEAHNARSDLSFEVFRRIRPACIIEWTATPARDQNVLYHVSAQQLKSEFMIKLPIVLSPHPNWQEAVRDAVLTRDRLAEEAAGEAEYVRPIALLQADSKDGEVPVDALKAYLQDTLHIEADRIAIATGSQRELDGVNLFDRGCGIDFVITVEALKEGWDCSFAYVFCTVQSIRSAKDMEQLLGRVLRLPYASQRKAEPLNRAYAHVSSPNTAQVAGQLADRLVAMGFEELEAQQFVQPQLDGDLFSPRPKGEAPPPSSQVALPAAVVTALQSIAPECIRASDQGDAVTVTGILPAAAIAAAVEAAPKRDRESVARELERHQARAQAALCPAQRGLVFAPLPQLCVPLQGDLQLLEPALLDEILDFSLATLSADLQGFAEKNDARPYLIDIERGQLRIGQDQSQYALDLNANSETVRRGDVIRELDRRVRRDDVLQPDMIAWLGRVLDGLEARGIALTYLARHMNDLADAVARQLAALVQEGRTQAFQRALFDGPDKARLSDRYAFSYSPDPADYPARWLFSGRWVFNKHYYPRPGELDNDSKQEETACAIELDGIEEVQFWVRNLERQPEKSFWLPTPKDRFYPDFVAQLKDGRMLVVEYKGAHLWSGAQGDRDIGDVWARASEGKCVFVMATDPQIAGKSVAAQLRGAIG